MPELVDRQPEWEVEQILRVRRHWCQVQYLIRWKCFSKAHNSWELASNVHVEELIQEFYKKHPNAIRNITTQHTSIIIHSITMSSPTNTPLPLAERIDSAPLPLTLAERLERTPPSPRSQSPSLEYPLHQLTPKIGTYPPDESSGQVTPTLTDKSTYKEHELWVANKPEGFIMYYRRLENHVKYGDKLTLKNRSQGYPHYIRFNHDYVNHHHYIHTRRLGLDSIPYRWPLTAAPFMGPRPSPLIADSMNLAPFTRNYPFYREVDIALYSINNHGLITDVDVHWELEEQEQLLTHRHRELDNDTLHLEHKLGPIHRCLRATQAYPCVHPYLDGDAMVPRPHSHNPVLYRDYPLTMEQAMGLSTMGQVHWLPRPWYHDEDQPGRGTQFSLCHNLCPYCNNPNHSPPQYPAPIICVTTAYAASFHCTTRISAQDAQPMLATTSSTLCLMITTWDLWKTSMLTLEVTPERLDAWKHQSREGVM